MTPAERADRVLLALTLADKQFGTSAALKLLPPGAVILTDDERVAIKAALEYPGAHHVDDGRTFKERALAVLSGVPE